MTRVMVLALFMYATLYAGMAKSREECATAADPTKCMAGSDGEVLLQSKLAVDHTNEHGIDDDTEDVDGDGKVDLGDVYSKTKKSKRDDDVEGLDGRNFHSLLMAMPLVLSNISNYSALYASQTTKHTNVTHKFGKDKAGDARLLLEMVDGFFTLMQEEVLDKDDKACPSNSVMSINGCLARAMCLMQFYVDGGEGAPDKSEMKKYTLIEELYTRFEDMTWPQTMSMLGVGQVYDPRKTVGFASPDQHSCDADSAWDKEEASLLETSTQMAAAYHRSRTLVSATKATHAILDAHTRNSSVEATVAALHGAWKPACELLQCDGTNYRDLWRASHAHSLNLMETGASARHMQVHIRTRNRLELRMQQFLGRHGAKLGDKVHNPHATTWRSAPKQYFSQGRGALLHTVVSSVTDEAAPISTRAYPLRLIDGHKFQQSLLEQGKHQSLKFLRSDAALLVNDRANDADDDDEEFNLMQADVDSVGEDENLRDGGRRRKDGEAGQWGRIGKTVSKSANAVGNFQTPGWDAFEQGLHNGVEEIKAIQPTEEMGLNDVPKIDGIVGEVGKLTWGKYVSIVALEPEDIVTKLAAKSIDGLESLGNDVSAVTTKFAHVAANAAEEVARYMLSLFACAGAFSEGFGHGYGTKIPDDAEAIKDGIWPMGVQMALGVTVDGKGPMAGIADLLNGAPLGVSLIVVISVVFGACPGAAITGGPRVGLGVTAGFGCPSGSLNEANGPDCMAELKLGATGSALIPSEGCMDGVEHIGPFKCFFAYSVDVSIMCCNFWVITGEGNCR